MMNIYIFRRMLRMLETGLVNYWVEMYLPKPVQCLVDRSSRQAILADIRNPALVNLHGLAPAFLFLLFGLILASMALLTEWMTTFQFSTLFIPLLSRSPSQIEGK